MHQVTTESSKDHTWKLELFRTPIKRSKAQRTRTIHSEKNVSVDAERAARAVAGGTNRCLASTSLASQSQSTQRGLNRAHGGDAPGLDADVLARNARVAQQQLGGARAATSADNAASSADHARHARICQQHVGGAQVAATRPGAGAWRERGAGRGRPRRRRGPGRWTVAAPPGWA